VRVFGHLKPLTADVVRVGLVKVVWRGVDDLGEVAARAVRPTKRTGKVRVSLEGCANQALATLIAPSSALSESAPSDAASLSSSCGWTHQAVELD